MAETIYGLVSHKPDVPIKPPMYKSRHDPACKLAGSTFGAHGTTQLMGAASVKKEQHGTFGRPVEALRRDPARYLKKGERSQGPFKPPRESAFKYPSTRRMDTAERNYLDKEDYGRVPKYLDKVKDEISRENKMIDTFVREQMGLEGTKECLEQLGEGERATLVHALKSKWDAVNERYQLMAHIVNLDTFGKLHRKEQMERELKELEGDIEKLKNTPVLVRP